MRGGFKLFGHNPSEVRSSKYLKHSRARSPTHQVPDVCHAGFKSFPNAHGLPALKSFINYRKASTECLPVSERSPLISGGTSVPLNSP